MGYKHTSSKGKTYFLNGKTITLNGGKTNQIYFFSSTERPESSCDIPEDREVVENAKTGFPLLKKKQED